MVLRAPVHIAFRDGAIAEVGSSIAGRIIEIHVRMGDEVAVSSPLSLCVRPKQRPRAPKPRPRTPRSNTGAPKRDARQTCWSTAWARGAWFHAS
jgi:pyruvate/2-oxoglutarate dehydrogenase complex dihydrolipoamide acyltransferase (E2) component